METLDGLIHAINWESLLTTSVRILLISCLGMFAMWLAGLILSRLENRLIVQSKKAGEPTSEATKRVETLVKLIRQGVRGLLVITLLMVILRELGVDVAPILASAGVLGLAVGFGAQNLVRDIISGFFFILENQVRVGDVATVNGTTGLVESMNFRTIVLRDIGGVVHIFPNGTVNTLSNLTLDWSAYVLEIGVAYKEDPDQVIELMKQVGAELQEDEALGRYILQPIEVFGVDKLADSAVIIKGRIRTAPIRQWDVGRAYLKRIKYALDEAGIEIPFPHRTMYFGEASKPIAVALAEQARFKTSDEEPSS